MKRPIAIALMVVGMLCVLSAIGLWMYNLHENQMAKDSADVLMQTIRRQMPDEVVDVDPFDEEMKVVDIDGYGYIGYLSVPSLNLDLPVMSTWDYKRLKKAPCRYYGSTKNDNLVIAAHNYKYHFGYLGKLQIGDVVTFTDMDAAVRHYHVVSVEVLSPTAVDQVKDTGDDLVLYTCTYSGSKRIVVRCRDGTRR